MTRRRIWSETVPHETLMRAETLGLLRSYGLQLLVAVGPGDGRGLVRLLEQLQDADVSVGLWPQLPEAQGRWVNASNVEVYCDQVRQLVDELDQHGALPMEVAVDLEPPFETVAGWLTPAGPRPRRIGKTAARWLSQQWRPRRAQPAQPASMGNALQCLNKLVSELRDGGIAVSSALLPLVLLDDAKSAAAVADAVPGGWQALLGTPVDGIEWDHASVMVYGSLLEGWSRGMVDRQDALTLLDAACRAARERFGPAAGVSLGVVGTGAFGHEPVYRCARELAEEVSVARQAGVETLTLFDLGGVLSRPPAEQWLEAFVGSSATARAQAASSNASRRRRWEIAAALAFARAIGRVARRLHRR